MMDSFDWRRLTGASTLAYRLDPSGRIDLFSDTGAPPFDQAHVRDGTGGFQEAPLESLGLVWAPGGEQAWELRTRSEPITMMHIHARWGDLVTSIAGDAGVDPRFVLTTIACEAGNISPDAGGYVKAPRTERGYPRRTGESDAGDEARDAEDWTASGGAHSSHGLMQTLIATAYGMRPDLFAGVNPARFREVLWQPNKSLAAGIAYLASFPAGVRTDPLALRFAYGAGSVRPSSNRWGAVLYDEIVPLRFIAFWNDLAAALTGAGAPLSTRQGTDRRWVVLGVSLLAFSVLTSVGVYLQTKQMGKAAA